MELDIHLIQYSMTWLVNIGIVQTVVLVIILVVMLVGGPDHDS